MTPDPDDDIRALLRRRADSIEPQGSYADVERKLAAGPPAPGAWQRRALLGAAAVLAVLLGAGVTALATRDTGRSEVSSTDSPATFATTSTPTFGPSSTAVPGTSTPATTSTPTTTVDVAPPTSTTTTTEPVPTTAPLTEASRVGVRGIGDLALPLSVQELQDATGQLVDRTAPEAGSTCSYLTVTAAKGGPAVPTGVAFMTQGDDVVRVEVREGSKVLTISGAGLGTTEAELQRLYPKAVVRAGKYSSPEVPTNDVVVTSASAKGSELIFETTKGVVTSYRAGQADAVELVEGCY
ncbi:hypothetical protein KSP35_10165 [Aquihabitans sp. G128]|uniref:hypothetical protein n=1 Tax=Aquihabitans sp. G128 TaxID=2849779 RepID=UPI001C22F3D4|nr:hypothetical protein [Aquihabitans sp. G128]QXC63105.1 hypothetical protein KSP35_10165 [Aquihabitans sp. G128]